MLTPNELEWLNYRKGRTFCRYCDSVSCANIYSWGAECPIGGKQNYKDVAEFEARVAKKLATERGVLIPCVCDNRECTETYRSPEKFGIKNWGKCDFCRLKYARLLVEEEMDAN